MKILHPNTPLFYFVLLTMLLLSSMVTAQTDLLPENRTSCYGGFGYLSFSGEQLNLSDLNTVLSENAYGTLNVYSSSLGGGGSFAAHNFLIGGGGAWLMNTNTQNQVNTCELKGGYGYFSFGYVLHAGNVRCCTPALASAAALMTS